MQVHKITLYVVDFDRVGGTGAAEAIETARYPNRCISPNVLSIETREIGEWSDDHPLNRGELATDEIRRLFGETKGGEG